MARGHRADQARIHGLSLELAGQDPRAYHGVLGVLVTEEAELSGEITLLPLVVNA